MSEHNDRSAGSEVQLPLSTEMVLTAAKEVKIHLDNLNKPYSAGIVADCIVEIERLRDRLSFAEFEWNRATDGMKERDATIAFLSGAPAQPEQVPFAWVMPGSDTANDRGFIDAMAWEEGEFTKPLYASQPSPAATVDQERIAELQNEAGMYKSLYENLQSRSSAGSEPVAYRVKDFADGWILCHTREVAEHEADGQCLIEPLYRAVPQAAAVTDEMIIACVKAADGFGVEKRSHLWDVTKRGLEAAIALSRPEHSPQEKSND